MDPRYSASAFTPCYGVGARTKDPRRLAPPRLAKSVVDGPHSRDEIQSPFQVLNEVSPAELGRVRSRSGAARRHHFVDLEAPDHTTLSRRSQSLNVGEGEWAAAKHGGRGRRGWKKLHLGVDRTGMIVAQALTHGSADDAKTALDLVHSIENDIESLTADSAYDTLAIYDASAARSARVVVPPSRSATQSRQRRSPSSARSFVTRRSLVQGFVLAIRSHKQQRR